MKSLLKGILPAIAVFLLITVCLPSITADAANPDKAKLDELRATDQELERGVAALDKEIARQQAEVDAAKQSIESADRTLAVAEARIRDLQSRLEVLEEFAVQRAVNEYMQPSEGVVIQILTSKGFDDASRRAEIMRELNGANFNAVDEMRALNRDVERERKVVESAKKAAETRRDEAQKTLDALRAARDEKQRLERELSARIAAASEEDSVVRKPDSSTANMEISASGLVWPTASHTVTSPYGRRWGRMHEGIDVAASVGNPIYAVKSGVVTWAGTESGYGNYICVQHGGGFQTCNGHASRIEVKKGDQVSQGQIIGRTGNTGASRGPHLHFETCASNGPSCVYGTTKNPMNYLGK